MLYLYVKILGDKILCAYFVEAKVLIMARSATSRKDTKRPAWRAFACLLGVGTLLALSLVIAKLADQAAAPRLSFLMAAMAGAACVLTGIAALQDQPMPLTRRTLEYAVVSGVLFALPNAFAFLAVRHVGAGFIALSFAFPILVTWLLAVLLQLERLRMVRLLGVLLGLGGGVLLAAAKARGVDGAHGWAVLVVAIPVILAVGNVYLTLRWPSGTSPVFLAALMLLGGALTLLPFALISEPGQLPALLGSAAVGRLLLLEIAVFAIQYVFLFVLQRLAGPVYLSQIGTVAALVGTLVAVGLMGEAPPPNLALAGTLVALGLTLFHRGAQTVSVRGALGASRTPRGKAA